MWSATVGQLGSQIADTSRTRVAYIEQKSVLCSYDILVTVSNAPKRECDVEVT
jgi:hypothetical protein